MKLNLFTQIHLKDFPFYLPIIFALWFRYLQTNSKIPRKMKKYIFQRSADLNSKDFSVSKVTESLGKYGCRQKCFDKQLPSCFPSK